MQVCEPRQTEIVWKGKKVRDGISVMYADRPATNSGAISPRENGANSDLAPKSEEVRAGNTVRCLKSVGVIEASVEDILPHIKHLEEHSLFLFLFLSCVMFDFFF